MRALVFATLMAFCLLSVAQEKTDIIVGFDGLKPLKEYTNIFIYSYRMELLYVEEAYKGETIQSFKKRIEEREKPSKVNNFLSLEELEDSLMMAYANEPSSKKTLISPKKKTCKLFLSSLGVSMMTNALILTVVVLFLRKK